MTSRELQRPAALRALVPCLTLLTLLALSAPARAYHTEQEHLTDDTAHWRAVTP